MEEEGVIPKAKRINFGRGRSMRVYKAEELEQTVSSKLRERWGAKHPGRWE
jgi:hypothetical protein